MPVEGARAKERKRLYAVWRAVDPNYGISLSAIWIIYGIFYTAVPVQYAHDVIGNRNVPPSGMMKNPIIRRKLWTGN